MIFIMGGLTSHNYTEFVIYMVKQAVRNGFDVCFIGYRGACGVEITTPKLYCYNSIDDILEPM